MPSAASLPSLRRHLALAGALASGTALLAAAAPVPSPAQAAPAVVRVSGSSTVFPITTEAIRSFRQSGAGRSVRFDLRENGTSAGLREFCSAAVPIAAASRPISGRELKDCQARGIRFVELPIAFDAITVVVHPRNSWASLITLRELARLWGRQAQGRIGRWNQVNIDWPATPIRLCGPGRDSGTYDYFNKAINGSADDSRRDVTTSEDDAVLVSCVARDPQALGYFGYGWYAANRSRLKALAVVGPKGAVTPSLATVQQEQYSPLSRPLFLYVNNEALQRRPEVQRFVTHLVRQGPQLVRAARFIPLPEGTYRLVENKLYRHVLGSAFGGDLPVGLTVREALARSLDRDRRPEFR